MNITNIVVPREVRYISQFKDFKLQEFPHIIDKQIPGCGFTEWCIMNDLDLILVCPRKILLENKENQHPGEVFYAKSELLEELGIDKNLQKPTKLRKSTGIQLLSDKEKQILEQAEKEAIEKAKKEREFLKREIESYWFIKQGQNKKAKILVTYDSFRKIKEILEELGIFNEFYVVVDEFQSIFVDSRFKADTELEFMNILQGIQRLCYVSATPMIETYLDKLDAFKNLPYYKLDWISENPGRVRKPGLTIRSLSSVNQIAESVINSYLSGEYEESIRINEDGSKEIVKSTEAVFYVNSVNNIIGIINKCNLKPGQVNILCANNTDNQLRIKTRLGKNFSIGEIPLKGQPHKMFTFCTRTVYLGADFYSDNARSFIISDANKETLSVDRTLDLPQILGRQRLNENPWKNKATIFVKTSRDSYSQEEFNDYIDKKMRETRDLLNAYSSAPSEAKIALAKKYLKDIESSNYRDDYVAVNKHGGNKLCPDLNHLVLIAEQRAFEIQQLDYADRFTVFNRLEEILGLEQNDTIKEVNIFLDKFEDLPDYYRRMQFLCQSEITPGALPSILDSINETYKRAYLILGPERCRACGYNQVRIEKEINILGLNQANLQQKILEKFKPGERLMKTEIKERLRQIYQEVDYKKTAKATDLEEWFEVKEVNITDTNGKRGKGFEILSAKTE